VTEMDVSDREMDVTVTERCHSDRDGCHSDREMDVTVIERCHIDDNFDLHAVNTHTIVLQLHGIL